MSEDFAPACVCGTFPPTVHHLLLDCPRFHLLRSGFRVRFGTHYSLATLLGPSPLSANFDFSLVVSFLHSSGLFYDLWFGAFPFSLSTFFIPLLFVLCVCLFLSCLFSFGRLCATSLLLTFWSLWVWNATSFAKRPYNFQQKKKSADVFLSISGFN